MEVPNFFAIIPADVRYHKTLKANAKLLYGEITALCGREGFCWASNDYFSELYEVDKKTISRWISQLSVFGFIDVELLKSEGNKRKITIGKIVNTYTQKSHEVVTKKSIAIDKKVTSNIRMNNTINNTINREENALAFFEKNYPERFENLMMKFRKQITDFVKFSELFEATVMQENLVYDGNVLEGRFKKFAINWIANQNRYESTVIELNANQRKDKIGGF